MRRFDDEFDLLVTPTMAIEPPKVGLLDDVHAAAGPTIEIVAMAAFTCVFNITGQPAISLPLHMAPSGLPVGVQVVAGPWREAQLIGVARSARGRRALGGTRSHLRPDGSSARRSRRPPHRWPPSAWRIQVSYISA